MDLFCCFDAHSFSGDFYGSAARPVVSSNVRTRLRFVVNLSFKLLLSRYRRKSMNVYVHVGRVEDVSALLKTVGVKLEEQNGCFCFQLRTFSRLFTIQVTNCCRAYVLEFIQLLDEVLKNSLFAPHAPRSELMADEKRDFF